MTNRERTDARMVHDLDAEKAVLGAALIASASYQTAAEIVGATDFYRQAHQTIWRALASCVQAGDVLDALTLRAQLDANGHLDDVGGFAYVSSLTDGVPCTTNVGHYAMIVRRHALTRHIATAGHHGDTSRLRVLLDDLDGIEAAADGGPEPFVDLADAEHGAMMPDTVIPRLAWCDSVSVLFGAPKIGKSTLLGQAVGAAVTGAAFLGETSTCGQIAIVTEEPIRLAAARLHKYGIPDEQRGAVFLVRVGAPGLAAALRRIAPALIVFDSLAAWLASVGVQRFSDAGEIRGAFNELRGYADTGAAVLAVHHSRKSDDSYADSRDIAGSCDMLIGLHEVKKGARRARTLEPRGRWPADPVRLGFDSEARYCLDTGAPAGSGDDEAQAICDD